MHKTDFHLDDELCSELQTGESNSNKKKSSRDGTAGFYAPEPLDVPFLRVSGAGTSGIEVVGQMSHSEHIAAVRNGQIASMHSWELVTAVDGPGTRFTLFLSGCPLRCKYCHNPDTFKMSNGTTVELSEIVHKIKRYKAIFAATNGGLTVSGGEPMMQPAFITNLLKAAKAEGIHTCVDTSGYLGMRVPQEIIDNVDLFLLDIKSGDPHTYEKVTGRPIAPTLEFSRHIAKLGKQMWIRFVLVPGLTDDPENVNLVAKHVASIGKCVQRVEVIPFHNMAKDKWERTGIVYELANTQPPSKELIQNTKDIFASYSINVF